MTIPKPLLFLALLLFVMPVVTIAQCNVKVDYSFKKNSEDNYSIYLRSEKQIEGVVKVQLYDLYQGKIVKEKEIHQVGTRDVQIFTDVKSSRYSLFINIQGCEKTIGLGGISGINLETGS